MTNYYLTDSPEGFVTATCKCGKMYAYCGLDMGYCVECIDNLEIDKNDEK